MIFKSFLISGFAALLFSAPAFALDPAAAANGQVMAEQALIGAPALFSGADPTTASAPATPANSFLRYAAADARSHTLAVLAPSVCSAQVGAGDTAAYRKCMGAMRAPR